MARRKRRWTARISPQRVVSAKVPLGKRLVALWASRELLGFLVRKELKVRYKNSVLGFVWSFLNPALVLLIYYVVFKYFLHNTQPDFALYLFAGLLAWNLFNNSLLSASGVLVSHAGIVKKVAFSREILALAQVGTAICYFFFQTCILVVFLVGFQVLPDFTYVPVLLLALVADVILSAGLAVFLSAVNVYLRDVQHFVEVLLVALFFSPPIVYAFHGVGLTKFHLRMFYEANPLLWIVLSFQRCLYGNVVPPGGKLVKGGRLSVMPRWGMGTYYIGVAAVIVGGLLLCLFAMIVFGRCRGQLRRGALRTPVSAGHRRPERLQALPALQGEVHLVERADRARRQCAIRGILGAAAMSSSRSPQGETVGDPRPERLGQVDAAQVHGRDPAADLGQILVRGQLAAMLELGAGFQPELSGTGQHLPERLAARPVEARDRARFDDIVAFAELEQFIDNQVKYYSSGMYVRLGFAVAVNVDPDILLVDEVLAVGDERFQQKCMERVQQFKQEGRTIVVVSHAADVMRQICDRVAVIDAGALISVAAPGEAIRAFRDRLIETGDAATPLPAVEETGGVPVVVDPTGPIPLVADRRVAITGCRLELPAHRSGLTCSRARGSRSRCST